MGGGIQEGGGGGVGTRPRYLIVCIQGGGGIWCLVNFAVVNFATGNVAETPGFL